MPSFHDEHRTVNLIISNDVAEIAIIRDALDRLGLEKGIPSKAIIQLQVALDEVVSNIIKYAWTDGNKHQVIVRIVVERTGVHVNVRDDGRTYDPRTAPAPPSSSPDRRPRPGGVGIHMLKRLVDRFDYSRIDGCNSVTLTKRCTVDEPAANGEYKMPNSSLVVTQSRSEEVCIVKLAGRIDSTNADDLMKRLSNLISSGEKTILIDFGGILYLTSAAFRALLFATDEAERTAARIVLCSVIGPVRELFEMGGLLDAFTILGSHEEALKHLV